MGFLADLGAGIQRGALAGAGALSEDVYREQANQRAARVAQGREQQQAVAQHILQAVHNGQVDDANLPELQQQLSKMGYNIPMQAFGPSIEAKHALATYANGIAQQKRAADAAKQLMDYRFGGQQGLVPAGLAPAGLGLAGRPGLSALDSMMPKADPQSSLGMDFTPDHFDQAPGEQPLGTQAPSMPPKLHGLPPPIVQSPTRVPGPTGVQSFSYNPNAQTGQGLETGDGHAANMPPIPAESSPTGVKSFAYDPNAQTGPGLETQAELPQSPDGTYQLPPMEVTGRLLQRPSVPQQSVALPVLPSPMPASPANIQAGTPDMDELYRRAMYAMQNGVPGGKDMLDYVIKMRETAGKPDYMSVGEGQSVFDKHTGKIVMQVKPKANMHVVDGALVDDAGNVLYRGTPEQLKTIQEFNAMLDQAKITDPVRRQQEWEGYLGRKGAGVTVNTGNIEDPRGKLPINHRWKPDGSGDVERIPGGPADELTPHQKQQVIGIQNTKFAISEYRDELNKMKTADYASPNARAKLESRYSAMILLSKEAFNLGVLNPNDRVILEEVVANPITFKGAILSKETLDEQTAQLDRIMGHMGDVSMQIRPQDAQKNTSAGAAASTPTRKIMTIKSGKDAGEYYQENGKWFKK